MILETLVWVAVVAVLWFAASYHYRVEKKKARTKLLMDMSSSSLAPQLVIVKGEVLSSDWASGYIFGWPFSLASVNDMDVFFTVPAVAYYYKNLSPDEEWNFTMWKRAMSLGTEAHNGKGSLEWKAGQMAALEDAKLLKLSGTIPSSLLGHVAMKAPEEVGDVDDEPHSEQGQGNLIDNIIRNR